jgi:ATP-dependent DNA ligase
MQSLYPLIRLYAPDNDNARTYQMKDRLIAQSYCSVLGFSKGTKKYDMLYHFTDPAKCPPHLNGDLSLVVEHIMRERTADTPSKLNIGEVNKLLDELHSLGNRHHHHNHTFRETKSPNKGERSKTVAKSRGKWLKKVVEKGLSPVEHKWLVRIILKKPEYGFGYTSLLKHLSPYAMELWSAHTSLKSLCDTLAYPQYERSRQQEEENEKQFEKGTATRWEPQKEKVAIGNIFAPMMSGKLYFEKAMSVISTNHTIYLKTSPEKACLALRFPAICAEVKLDGERMLAHVLDGKVTIQTRNRNWYSDLYSPVLGAPIRRALSNHRVNVILDGEVMAWDNVRKDLVPFGSNRTIANYRR